MEDLEHIQGEVIKAVYFTCPNCGDRHSEQEGCGGFDQNEGEFEYGCASCGCEFTVEY